MPEEVRKRKQEEFAPIGQALADRYLSHGYGKTFRDELDKYDDEEKNIAVNSALSRLVEAIDLEDNELSQKALEGLMILKEEDETGEIREGIRALCAEYEQAKKQRYEGRRGELEREQRELLHQLRISGDAVGEINLEASNIWREISRELSPQFSGRLNTLKRELLKLVTA